ncbi:MAG: NAD(P)-dependent oxidoreductase [Pseudomonadota bacterium]|nr:NAD(P)-dependent oxidoreductase [Pseudomonadota bacterium]
MERNIGVIGLGSLGAAMAARLGEDGWKVHGYDIDQRRLAAAATQGVIAARSPAEVAAACEVILLSLPDSDAVEAACLGDQGAARAARDGQLIIDTTSGYPPRSRAIAAQLASRGVRYVDAAITAPAGGANAVRQGALTFIVGGAQADVEAARPVLELLGSRLFHVGPLGAGQIVKLVNNTCAAIASIATLEGLLVAAKHGLDLWQNLEVMRVGTGHTAFARHPRLLMERDRPGAHIGLMTKDVAYMSRLAQEARVPLPVGDAAGHLYRMVEREVGADAGIMKIADVMERWADARLTFHPGDETDARRETFASNDCVVGLIGLGNIGEAVNDIFQQDGVEVWGYDIDPDALARAAARGLHATGSPREVAQHAQVVILALPQSKVVREVLFGEGGVAEADNPGLLVVDTTSGYPDETRGFGALLAERRMRLIDAAITGERGGAFAIPERNLTFIVGGEAADVLEARQALDHFSSHLFHLGSLGAGQIAKMVNNMVCAVVGVGIVEGLLVAAKLGVDYQKAAEAMDQGTGASFWTHNRALLNPEPMTGGFYVGLMTKDLRQMSRFAHDSGVPNPLGDLTYHLYQLFCRDLGYFGGIAQKIEVMQRWAGIRLDGQSLELEDLE